MFWFLATIMFFHTEVSHSSEHTSWKLHVRVCPKLQARCQDGEVHEHTVGVTTRLASLYYPDKPYSVLGNGSWWQLFLRLALALQEFCLLPILEAPPII